jgi:two-component system heavy metal sensor histidine kinase CusS
VLDARAELDRVAEYFEAVAADNNVSVAVSGQAIVRADQTLLRRAVTNVVDNALRHAPAGTAVTIDVGDTGHATRIRVTNGGPGIPREALPQIFGRFYRADPARSNSANSTGLGLAIVDTIMRLHGGNASVRSDPGATVLEMVFPMRRASEGARPTAMPMPRGRLAFRRRVGRAARLGSTAQRERVGGA